MENKEQLLHGLQKADEIISLRNELQTSAHFLACAYLHKLYVNGEFEEVINLTSNNLQKEYMFNRINDTEINRWMRYLEFNEIRKIFKYSKIRFVYDVVEIIQDIFNKDADYK